VWGVGPASLNTNWKGQTGITNCTGRSWAPAQTPHTDHNLQEKTSPPGVFSGFLITIPPPPPLLLPLTSAATMPGQLKETSLAFSGSRYVLPSSGPRGR
jgi:hypothetical protein